MNVKLFVIVVTYKGKQWYDRCFASLRESTLPVQTIVVDNASSDGSVEYIKENYPEIHLIESDENLGFGRANNLGMRYALDQGCDYVFLLNQDAWVEPDTFEKMVAIHQHHKEYGILGCINVTKEKDHMLDGFIPMISDPSLGNMALIDDMYFSRMQEVYEIKYILAAAWLLPRVVLETVGGFNPIFFHFGEDDNYMQRALYHGFKIGVCPNCPIVHDSRKETQLKDAVEYRKKQYTKKRGWILEWSNVNNVNSFEAVGKVLRWKWVKQLLQFKFKKASYYLEEYRCYKDNKDAIRESLQLCRTKGPPYL